MKAFFGLFGVFSSLLASCEEASSGPEQASWEKVQAVWSGGAEISRYELQQERYGELRKGEAVLIFVREPFLKDRQVKDESGQGNFQVLKMNATRNFLTGVYPYQTMISVFQPLEKGSAGEVLKVTTSIQEWCGHVFMQSNRRQDSVKTEVKSYFEKEDNRTFEERGTVFLEDEVWTALRVDPFGLPVGQVRMVPGTLFTRFTHQEPVAESAQTRWLAAKGGQTVTYEITYPQSGRTLAIEIQKKLPYSIQSWTESRGQVLLSSGLLKKQLNNVDYWNYNDRKNGKKLRSKLGF
jgi:hypothetical protein